MAKWLHKMKQIGLKYRLIVLALIAISLLPIALCTFCFGRKAEGEKDAGSSEAGGRLIPISQLQMPVELAEEVEIKSQAFLKFFKTPTQQFIPLIFSAMVHDIRDSEKLEALRQRGIILFHKYAGRQSVENAMMDLRSAQKAGVAVLQNLPRTYLDKSKAIYNATDSPHLNAKEIKFWQRHISALAGNGQILVWYLPEEAKAKELNKLEQIGNIIRATDDKKRPLITYVVNWRAKYLKRVNSITDAVVFGFYPNYYGVKPRIEIKRRIEHAYKSGVSVVIAALEAFKGKAGWPRPKDVRFDAYLALISGAKGIMWYCYAQAKQRPQLLEAVLEVATELNGPERLGEVLLLGKEPRLLGCKTVKGHTYFHDDYIYGTSVRTPLKLSSIQWTAREYEKYLYIFAVNTAQELGAVDDGGKACTVEVEFGPVSSVSSGVHVISEGRTINLSGGYFADSFEPLGTHIYKVRID